MPEILGRGRVERPAELGTDQGRAGNRGDVAKVVLAAVTEARRDGATAVTSALAARAGVWGVRVHDVAATRDALRVAELWGGSDAAAR